MESGHGLHCLLAKFEQERKYTTYNPYNGNEVLLISSSRVNCVTHKGYSKIKSGNAVETKVNRLGETRRFVFIPTFQFNVSESVVCLC